MMESLGKRPHHPPSSAPAAATATATATSSAHQRRRHGHNAGIDPRNALLLAALVLGVGILVWYEAKDERPSSTALKPPRRQGGGSSSSQVSLKDRISAAAERHFGKEEGGKGPSAAAVVDKEGAEEEEDEAPRAHNGGFGSSSSGGGGRVVTQGQCDARVESAKAKTKALCGASSSTSSSSSSSASSSLPAWQRFVPPAFVIPGHQSGRQAQQAKQLTDAEERMKRISIFGEEGSPEEGGKAMPSGSGGAQGAQHLPAGLDYPGEIKLRGKASNYSIGGMGLLRAEPYLAEGSGFYVINAWQIRGAFDSFFVRLVGPSIVAGECRVTKNRQSGRAEGVNVVEYLCTYGLREPGVYTLQVWAEYRDLPSTVIGAANPKGDDPDPMVANAYTFERAELLLYTGLVDGRYAEGSAASMAAFARADLGALPGAGAGMHRDAHGPRECATGLRPGRWVARATTGCPASEYRLLREAWEWRPLGCRLREFCGAEAAECLQRFRTIAVAGDSIAREMFDEVGSVALQRDVSWREIFPHKHASGSRQVGDTMIKMMWIPDPLATITEHLSGPVQLREAYTEADLLIVSAGYWYLYRTSLEHFLDGVRNLTRATEEALGGRTRLVWVTIPSGWMNFGYRIRPRIQAWNEAATRIVSEAGWTVIDAFHLSDARPEKTDGTHIGNDTDRGNMQGAPTLSKSVANVLLGALCAEDGDNAKPKAAPEDLAPALPIEWPAWPNSRRYTSHDALLKATSLGKGEQGGGKERDKDKEQGKGSKHSGPDMSRYVVLGGGGGGGGAASQHHHHGGGGGKSGGKRPH